MYESKFVWRHSTLIIPSLKARRQSIADSIQKLPGSQGTHSRSFPEDRELHGRAFRSSSTANTHKTEISPSVRGLHATHPVHRLDNPYIPHTSTDMLQRVFYQPDYSGCYCEEHFRQLLILDRTESFVSGKS